MIHWLDESIVHSVLTGLVLLNVLGICWAVYIRVWQVFLWESYQESIQEALEDGYTLSSKWWKAEVSCVNEEGQRRRWRGGVWSTEP